ncbi:hypothetical protein [uncultured Aquimarina sp.]|nr:hypothetical protein [uncultured Aquimarina sp.]
MKKVLLFTQTELYSYNYHPDIKRAIPKYSSGMALKEINYFNY